MQVERTIGKTQPRNNNIFCDCASTIWIYIYTQAHEGARAKQLLGTHATHLHFLVAQLNSVIKQQAHRCLHRAHAHLNGSCVKVALDRGSAQGVDPCKPPAWDQNERNVCNRRCVQKLEVKMN
jgi:hypothetical protein